jgi:hypothetical protein
VAHDVVRVGVAAVLVVGRHDVRAELPDDAYERGGGHLDGLQREAAVGQRRQRIALGQPRVDEAQPRLPHAEDRPSGVHLLPADVGEVREHVGVTLQARIEDVAALAAGAGRDQHVHTFGDVARHRRGTFAGLVVRMRVDGEQPQPP